MQEGAILMQKLTRDNEDEIIEKLRTDNTIKTLIKHLGTYNSNK